MSGPAISWSSPWVEAIGWMLLHSLWQGAGVAMAMALVLYFLRRAPARARYLAACAAMLLIVALPIATLLRSGAPLPPPPPHHQAIAEPAIVGNVSFTALDPVPVLRIAGLRGADRLKPVLPAIVALWMAGVGVFSMRLLGGWIQARRWVRHGTRPMADPWMDRFARLKERLGVRRAVALLESARVEVPMVVGWLRPAILVPFAALAGLSAPELEAILAHELAHIRRHDYLINLIQCVVEVLVFYHPATWWISRVIRRERESCCDDLAVASCRDRVVYARALAAMEGLRVPAFSPSPAANGGILLARVRRILNPQEESMNPVRILAGLAVVLAVAPLWLAHAGDDRSASAATAKAAIPPSAAGPLPDMPSELGGPQERQDPFPNRSYADIVTSVDEAPTGRLMFSVGNALQPAVGPMAWGGDASRAEIRAWKDLDVTTVALVQQYLGLQAAPARPAAGPGPDMALPILSAENPAAGKLETSPIGLDPPSEAEVWARLPKASKDNPLNREVQRNNIRIAIEKIGDKVDPVKVYPLAGACQLVHCHYKCTVSYDELSWSDYPIPFKHIAHKVEVVYIDKDHLRRAGPTQATAGDSMDDRIDRVSREIEDLKRTRRRDRREQEQLLDRLIQELEGLKRELRDDPKGAGARGDFSRPGAFSFTVGGIY